MWCIQKITPEYKKRMYDILDLYEEEYDQKRPVIGFDEKPKQLIGEKRTPIPLKPGKPAKQDYTYLRNGTANIFMAVEPKGGKRLTQVTNTREMKDFARFIYLLVKKYPKAKLIRLILDNLSTHKQKAFYENLSDEQAKDLVQKIEFHYTPTHASWLNVAEIEIGVMDTECTDRRIENKEKLMKEIKAWTSRRNRQRKKINWAFTKEKADKKLGKYYTE